MEKKKFIRRDSKRYSRIGKNRKKLQKWRKPKGRDNKMREKRAGYPVNVSVGYKSSKKTKGKINDLTPCRVYNLNDLEKAGNDSIVIIGKIGAKKKAEIIKKAVEMKLKIGNMAREKDAK